MKENKHSLKISRSFFGDTTLDGYPIATYSNDELKNLKWENYGKRNDCN